jgi:hypothetical protein
MASRSAKNDSLNMDRKEFLTTLISVPAGLFLVHCSDDSDPSTNKAAGASGNDPYAPGAAPTRSGSTVVYTCSTVGQHIHTFVLEDSALAAPPASGINGDSSTDGMHSHTVAISAGELAEIANGDSVQVTSGDAGSHTHVFTFTRIA